MRRFLRWLVGCNCHPQYGWATSMVDRVNQLEEDVTTVGDRLSEHLDPERVTRHDHLPNH